MKKLQLLVLLGVFAVGCQTDSTSSNTIEIGKKGVVLTASLDQTRTSLGAQGDDGDYPIYWSEGDQLVVNGEQSDEVQIDAKNRASATFCFSDAILSHPYHITYPYCTSTTAETPMVEFKAEQIYAEATFSADTAPMCGYIGSEGNEVKLNHLAAILHFPMIAEYEGVILERIVITSQNKIAGEFAVDCQNATITATESCKNIITYSLPADYTLSTTTPSDFFVVLPAVEVGTCTVEFVEASGEKMVATWTPSASLAKGVVREFKTISYRRGVVGALGALGSYEDILVIPFKKYADDNEIKVMSFNVRTKTTSDTNEKNWDNRKAACVELIIDHQPSIIGFQEAKFNSQWSYLKEQLANSYDGYGVNRDTGAESGSGEVMGILYKKSEIEKIDGGTFWLSETPDVASKGFGANYSRNATWGLFKHLPTGKTFYYINTHLDHQVAEAQIEGMKLISQHFEEYKDTYPLFLTGDMNIKADNVALDVIEGYMYNTRDNASASLTDYNTTYNGYTTTKSSIIDHIYCSNYLRVKEYHTIDEEYGGVPFVSDHYPIYAIIELK